ncbi:M23 family metallopeptidase [Mangrovibacterium diazotrophicum]|uniref:Peptidase M23-like protein n=1 Tax=Mangrovibacterium diazotrophicum TaxID=1261403 RepID=A0A419VX79_9BACT|nr:M23 family metallopeptidase [Mangrovibacterium diazotrophicum]RKD87774.1 peptidase M23-like protein [Mangrovibacterium diazotrophicum]
MVKAKYKFNPETLSYVKVEHNFKARLSRLLILFSVSLVMSVIMVAVFLQFYETPKTKTLKRENQRLATQYDLMFKNLEDVEKVLTDLQERDDNLYRVIFEADPIPNSIRKAGFGGINKYAQLESLDNSELVIKTARKLDIVSKQAYVQSKSYDELVKLAMNKEKMLASIPAVMPVSNKDLKRTASGWGFRIDPVYKIRRFHYGMDFSAPIGTEVYSTGDGVIKEVKTSRSGFGRWIVVDHGFGYETLYGHLNEFNVKVGDKVKRGSVIGYVGNAGKSTGPHLHYEVHKNGKPINPQFYYFKDLTPEEYDRMIALSANTGQSMD